ISPRPRWNMRRRLVYWSGVSLPRKPTSGSPTCADVTRGHAAGALPRRVIGKNSRLEILLNDINTLPHHFVLKCTPKWRLGTSGVDFRDTAELTRSAHPHAAEMPRGW